MLLSQEASGLVGRQLLTFFEEKWQEYRECSRMLENVFNYSLRSVVTDHLYEEITRPYAVCYMHDVFALS